MKYKTDMKCYGRFYSRVSPYCNDICPYQKNCKRVWTKKDDKLAVEIKEIEKILEEKYK